MGDAGERPLWERCCIRIWEVPAIDLGLQPTLNFTHIICLVSGQTGLNRFFAHICFMEDHARNGKSPNVQDILDRLESFEKVQEEVVRKIRKDHLDEMNTLRNRLHAAQQSRRKSELQAAVVLSPITVEVDMREVEAAVKAATSAEQDSARALMEARKFAEGARAASSGFSSINDWAEEEDGDSEYIVKQVTVNLDEVERIISISPLIEICRAFGRPDPKYGNEVYCAVVSKRDKRVSERLLYIHAHKYLATPMVPKRFFFLDELPIGVTRNALAAAQMPEENPNNPSPAGI